MKDSEDDWEEIWDTRIAALSSALNAQMVNGYHAPHPFALGGQADVLVFNLLGGSAFVTADVTGKPSMVYADYELMVCHRDHTTTWGADVVSRLAPYTQRAYIFAGDTMDIDDPTSADSAIKALIFDTYTTFHMFGETFDVRLGIGITKDELSFKLEHGSDALLSKLRQAAIYPFTDLTRTSVLTNP